MKPVLEFEIVGRDAETLGFTVRGVWGFDVAAIDVFWTLCLRALGVCGRL